MDKVDFSGWLGVVSRCYAFKIKQQFHERKSALEICCKKIKSSKKASLSDAHLVGAPVFMVSGLPLPEAGRAAKTPLRFLGDFACPRTDRRLAFSFSLRLAISRDLRLMYFLTDLLKPGSVCIAPSTLPAHNVGGRTEARPRRYVRAIAK